MATYTGAVERRPYRKGARQASIADAFPNLGPTIKRPGGYERRPSRDGARVTSIDYAFGPKTLLINRGAAAPETRRYGIAQARVSSTANAFSGPLTNRGSARPETRRYQTGLRLRSAEKDAFPNLGPVINRGTATLTDPHTTKAQFYTSKDVAGHLYPAAVERRPYKTGARLRNVALDAFPTVGQLINRGTASLLEVPQPYHTNMGTATYPQFIDGRFTAMLQRPHEDKPQPIIPKGASQSYPTVGRKLTPGIYLYPPGIMGVRLAMINIGIIGGVITLPPGVYPGMQITVPISTGGGGAGGSGVIFGGFPHPYLTHEVAKQTLITPPPGAPPGPLPVMENWTDHFKVPHGYRLKNGRTVRVDY